MQLKAQINVLLFIAVLLNSSLVTSGDNDLTKSITLDYENRLKAIFEDFHAHPELSLAEFETAKKNISRIKKSWI